MLITKIGLCLFGILFSIVGGFILDDDTASLMCFLIVVLCMGFVGLIDCLEDCMGKKREIK